MNIKMKTALALFSLLAFAPDALDTADTTTPDQVNEMAMNNVSERGKEFGNMTKKEAQAAFKKDLKALHADLASLFRSETYNLNTMLVLGERLGIDKSKSLEILEDIYLGGEKEMSEIVGKTFADDQKKDLEDYKSMQHALVRKIMDKSSPTRNKLMLLNDHIKMSVKDLDQKIVEVIKNVYKKEIKKSAMPAKTK